MWWTKKKKEIKVEPLGETDELLTSIKVKLAQYGYLDIQAMVKEILSVDDKKGLERLENVLQLLKPKLDYAVKEGHMYGRSDPISSEDLTSKYRIAPKINERLTKLGLELYTCDNSNYYINPNTPATEWYIAFTFREAKKEKP